MTAADYARTGGHRETLTVLEKPPSQVRVEIPP